jgi:hypothetical protein
MVSSLKPYVYHTNYSIMSQRSMAASPGYVGSHIPHHTTDSQRGDRQLSRHHAFAVFEAKRVRAAFSMHETKRELIGPLRQCPKPRFTQLTQSQAQLILGVIVRIIRCTR